MDTILLQIKDVKGNSTIEGYADTIILDSMSNGVSLPLTTDMANTERAMGRPSFSEISVSKSIDQSTPALYSACAAGTKLGDVTIHVGRNESGKFMPLLKYTLNNTMVSSINTGVSGGGADNLSLSYSKIAIEYTQQGVTGDKAGTASFGWDLAKNAPVAAPKK